MSEMWVRCHHERAFSTRALLLVLLLFAMASFSCQVFSRQPADEIFLSENPGFTIVNPESREGSSDILYDHFRYRKPGDPDLFERVWRYERGDSQWVLVDRGKETKVE